MSNIVQPVRVDRSAAVYFAPAAEGFHMIKSSLGVAVFSAVGMLTYTSAFSASLETKAFNENAQSGAAFIVEASKLAVGTTTNPKIRDFAKQQIATQSKLLDQLRSYPSLSGAFVVARAETDDMFSGRSVGIGDDVGVATYAPPSGIGAMLPPSTISLTTIGTLKGDAFDNAYRQAVGDALGRLSTFSDAYARTGDDTGLRDLASVEAKASQESLDAIDDTETAAAAVTAR